MCFYICYYVIFLICFFVLFFGVCCFGFGDDRMFLVGQVGLRDFVEGLGFLCYKSVFHCFGGSCSRGIEEGLIPHFTNYLLESGNAFYALGRRSGLVCSLFGLSGGEEK